jgi:hypothetical protein
MLDQINAELLGAKEQVRAKRKLEAMLRETQQVLDDAHQRCNAHRRRLEAEKADVDKLEGLGLTALGNGVFVASDFSEMVSSAE